MPAATANQVRRQQDLISADRNYERPAQNPIENVQEFHSDPEWPLLQFPADAGQDLPHLLAEFGERHPRRPVTLRPDDHRYSRGPEVLVLPDRLAQPPFDAVALVRRSRPSRHDEGKTGRPARTPRPSHAEGRPATTPGRVLDDITNGGVALETATARERSSMSVSAGINRSRSGR